MGFKFLDLGCAPGGFSSYLLQDPRLDRGFVRKWRSGNGWKINMFPMGKLGSDMAFY